MTHTGPGPRPKESTFYEPMIYLLGKLTGFKAYVGAPHEAVRDDVLRLAGIDPETCPWPLRSISSKTRNGLYRVVHFAWYHQTRQYRPESEALCAKPISGARGEWALTELGVKKAKLLKEKFEGLIVLSAGPNVTAQHLGKHWNELWSRITLHLRRKMPRSEEFGKIEDHAMNWLERVMQRDGLRGRLEAGKSIPPSQVQAWARRGAYTDIRNEGREPVCRVLHGALTKKEIALHDPSNWTEVVMPRSINESENLFVNSYAAHSEDGFVSDPIDNLRDDHVTADVEGAVMSEDALHDVLGRVAEIIQDEIDPALDPDFHKQLMVEHFVQEMTVQEIADAHGHDDQREIKVSLNRVRDVMLRAREEGDFDDVIRR